MRNSIEWPSKEKKMAWSVNAQQRSVAGGDEPIAVWEGTDFISCIHLNSQRGGGFLDLCSSKKREIKYRK